MKMLFALWVRWALAFISLITLAGCSDFPIDVTPRLPRDHPRGTVSPPRPPSRLCSIFRESLWQEFRFGEDSAEDVIHTATLLWQGLNESRMKSYELYGDDVSWAVEWLAHSDGVRVRYLAEGGEERKLVSIRVDLYRGTTLARIFDCLGSPQYYWAEIPPDFVNGLGLGLWYVERGIRVSGSTYGGKVQPTKFHPEFRMNAFHVVPPGDLEKMISHLSPPSLHSNILCTLRPWPGSIEAIVIDSFLDENPRCEQ